MKFSIKFSISIERSDALERALSKIDISDITEVDESTSDSEPFGFAGTYLRSNPEGFE